MNRTPSHVTFSRVSRTHFNVAHDIGSRCLPRTSSMYHSHGVVVLILFDSPLCTLHRLSHLPFHSHDLHLHLPCGLVRREVHCGASANEELGTLADNNPLTGFTRFILKNERPPDGYTWSGERLTRKQSTSRHHNVRPEMWNHMSDVAKTKAKQKWAIEKPKLDNARQLRGIYLIEPHYEEFKHIMKNARRKFEIPMPVAMPCKTPTNCCGETCRSVGKHKTKYAWYCRCRRIYKNTIGRCAAQVS